MCRVLGLPSARCSARCQYSGWEVNWSTAMQATGPAGPRRRAVKYGCGKAGFGHNNDPLTVTEQRCGQPERRSPATARRRRSSSWADPGRSRRWPCCADGGGSFPNDKDGKDIAQPAAQSERDALQNRIVLVRADEHRAQHGGAAGGKAELAAAAGAQLAGQHAQQQPGHGHGRDAAGQVDDGPQGRDGQPCGQIITQPREKTGRVRPSRQVRTA